MTIKDVEAWSETEEGIKWLEEKKRPLNEKKNQLLEEVTGLKKRLADVSEQSNALDAKIKGYLENLKKAHCGKIFDDVENFSASLFEDTDLRQFVLSKIERQAEEEGGFISDIDENGNFTLKTSSGKTFADYYREWTKTENAKSFLKNPYSGGGARGSVNYTPTNYSKSTVANMSPQEIAQKLSDPTFCNSLKNLN